MSFLHRFVAFADGVNERIGLGVAWLTTVLVVVVCGV